MKTMPSDYRKLKAKREVKRDSRPRIISFAPRALSTSQVWRVDERPVE